MKKITLLFTLSFSVLIGFGQFGEGSPETMKAWKNKTLIVLQYPNYDIYNSAVKSVAEQRWYNDKIEYVTYAKRTDLKKRKDIVVLSVKQFYEYTIPVICLTTKMNGMFVYKFSRANDGWAQNYIQSEHEMDLDKFRENLKKERKKDKDNTASPSSIASGLYILNNSSPERIKLLVDVLFNSTDKHKKGVYSFRNSKKDNPQYNTEENISLIKTKTLLIEEKNLPRTSKNKKLLQVEKIKSLYKGDVKIVTENELKEAIKNKDKNALYFHVKEELSYPTFAIIDIAERRIVFCGQERTKPGDSSPVKIFERMLLNISNSIF